MMDWSVALPSVPEALELLDFGKQCRIKGRIHELDDSPIQPAPILTSVQPKA